MKNFEIDRVGLSRKGDNPDRLLSAAGGSPTSYRELLDRIASTSEKKKHPEQPIRNAPGVPQNETENRKCGICLEGFKPHSKIVNCSCGKSYHIICATQVGECPICDADLLKLSSRLMDRGRVKDYSFIWGK